MSTQSSAVYLEIQKILGTYFCGISYSTLSLLERSYKEEFNRLPNYRSLGVQNIDELVAMMLNEGKLLLSLDPYCNKTYVMSARTVLTRRILLKLDVEKLLDKYCGKIPFSSFQSLYKDMFMVKVHYHLYGVTDLDSLCEVLNLVVETTDSREKVIKAGKIVKSRKRKRDMLV